jgi:hypothetical protein
MKKIILFSIVFVNFHVVAQINRGNWMIGGSASFTSSEYKSSNSQETFKSFKTRINPNFGYFILNRFALGISPSFGFGNSNTNPSQTSYGANFFARYYFLKSEKIVNFFTEASYGYFTSKVEGISSISRGNEFKIGTSIFFNSSAAIEISGIYTNSFSESSNTDFKNLSIGLGFQIFLEK